MSKKLKISILLVLAPIALCVSYKVGCYLRYRTLTEELKRKVAYATIFIDPDSAEFRNVSLTGTVFSIPDFWRKANSFGEFALLLRTYLFVGDNDKLPTKVPPEFTEVLCGEIKAKNRFGVTGYLEFIIRNDHERRVVFPALLSTRLGYHETCKGKILYRDTEAKS